MKALKSSKKTTTLKTTMTIAPETDDITKFVTSDDQIHPQLQWVVYDKIVL